MRRLLHFFGGHDWTPWTKTGEGVLKKDGRVIGFFILQERTCKLCNYIERKQDEQ